MGFLSNLRNALRSLAGTPGLQSGSDDGTALRVR